MHGRREYRLLVLTLPIWLIKGILLIKSREDGGWGRRIVLILDSPVPHSPRQDGATGDNS
ncbi:MAG: hypothetical protein U1C49_02105 [Candidatus Andersenbacteria bacterium]|nr:hypothetical protein [bacterium]MDZ4225620.1 hypothetical protein [Candidatus Andersenbacteria bacterium]